MQKTKVLAAFNNKLLSICVGGVLVFFKRGYLKKKLENPALINVSTFYQYKTK